MKHAAAIVICCSVSSGVYGQALTPVAKLDSPAAMRYVAVCEGGGTIVGLSRDHDVYAWALSSRAPRALSVGSGRVWPLACTATTLAVASEDGSAAILNVDGVVQHRIAARDGWIVGVDWITGGYLSADGRLLALIADKLPVRVWDAMTGESLWTGVTDFGYTTSVAISHDGNRIVTANGDTKIRTYDRKGKLIYSVDGGLLAPFSVSLSADGRTFAVAGAEGTVELRDAATGKQLKKSESSGDTILWRVVIAPNGKTVMALQMDDGYRMKPVAIVYWDTASARLQKVAVDPLTVLGFGRSRAGLLLVRQETPASISIDSLQ